MKSLVVTFALLVGCTVGPQYQRPEIAVPKAFSEGAGRGPSSFEQWWTGFRDPLLDSLVARAVEGNLDLKVSAARIREARAARGISASAGLPQVDASGGYSRSKREILDLHGEALDGRIVARPLGHGPGKHHAVPFEAKVVVQGRGPVLLDHEGELALPSTGGTVSPFRLGADGEATLLAVFGERHGAETYARPQASTTGAGPVPRT